MLVLSNGKNVYPEELEAEITSNISAWRKSVHAGESKLKEVIVAEIYPDFEALKAKGITDVQTYFNEEIKKLNATWFPTKPLKSLNRARVCKEHFKKIQRFQIDKQSIVSVNKR